MSKHNELPMTLLPLRAFTFTGGDTLSTDASDLDSAFKIERIYNDACDVGIAIKSHHTNDVQKFALTEVTRNDNEVTSWVFENVNLKARVRCVIIYND